MSLSSPPRKRRKLNSAKKSKNEEQIDGRLSEIEKRPEWILSELFEEAKKAQTESTAQFCVCGVAPTPSIHHIELNQTIAFDDEKSLREIATSAQDAPVGVGEQTIIDRTRRVAKHLTNDKFVVLSDNWTKPSSQTNEILERIRGILTPDAPFLFSQLHKINIYEPGGFFKLHSDTFRSGGHIGSLVVFLPTTYQGGLFRVEHHGSVRTVNVGRAQTQSKTCKWIAFYADCPHEVARVESGIRMTLTFHLFVPPAVPRPVPTAVAPQPSILCQAIDRVLHMYDGNPQCIVFPLAHRYVFSEMSPTTLKGSDRKIYKQLVPHFGLKFSCVAITRSDVGEDDYGRRATVVEEGANNVQLCTPEYEPDCPDSEYGCIDGNGYKKGDRDLVIDEYNFTKHAIELETSIVGTGNEGCGINRTFRGVGLVVFKFEDAEEFAVDKDPERKSRFGLW